VFGKVSTSILFAWKVNPNSWLFAFLLVSLGGVRLSLLGTSATNWPIAPAPDDR
jgi:hypothetical protein